VDAEGGIAGTVEEIRSGSQAAELRSTFSTLRDQERADELRRRVTSSVPNSEVDQITALNVDGTDGPVTIRYHMKARNYGKRRAGLFLIRPRVIGGAGVHPVDLKDRKTD